MASRLAVFAALLVRTMLLDIAVVMGPLAIMGLAWEKTHGWFKKWVSVVIALIFTKLAVMQQVDHARSWASARR